MSEEEVYRRGLWADVRIFNTTLSGVSVLDDFIIAVGVLGIIYGEGDVDPGDEDARETFGRRLREDAAFSTPVALSVMVFFALCAQCASTIAIIRREAGGWGWAIFSFTYMTVLAYVGALVTYQIGRLFV